MEMGRGRLKKMTVLLLLVNACCMIGIWLVLQQMSCADSNEPDVIHSHYTFNQQLLPLQPFYKTYSEPELIEDIQKQVPSLPIVYWNKNKNKNLFYNNETCAKYPSIFELEFNNVYWQTLHTSNGTFYMYGAYYDIRSQSGPVVRILGMINRIEPTVKTFCQFWFDNREEPAFAKVMEYKYIWNKRGNYKQGILQPYLMACQIPKQYHAQVPASVSVVEKLCDIATNSLRVIYNKPPTSTKKGFAVCVKGLDFLHNDLSVRLIEWIELLGILGADNIFFYELEVHPNISKVLDFYKKSGRVDVTPLTLPGGQPNIPGFQHMYLKNYIYHKRQNEVIPYNDCFYKNLYIYDLIVLLDIDEVIMPLQYANWKQLMNAVKDKSRSLARTASYCVRNIYFLDKLLASHGWFKNIPNYMHMLQHVYRTKNFTKPNDYVKCFHSPEHVLTLHNHFPFACLNSECTSFAIDENEDARLHHYRSDCVDVLGEEDCYEFKRNSVLDTKIWAYKDELIARVAETLHHL